MYKQYFFVNSLKNIILILLLLVVSCQKDNPLLSLNECNSVKITNDWEKVSDFYDKIQVKLPKNWKTTLYYDATKSSIMTADTTQLIQDAYVTEFAVLNGNIKINNDFKQKVSENSTKNQLNTLNEKFLDYKQYKGFYHLSEGLRDSIPMRVLQYYFKLDNRQYLLFRTEIYGKDNQQQRLCEALQLMNGLEIKK